MFKGYNLTVDDGHFSRWAGQGGQRHRSAKAQVEKCLSDFFDADGVLSAAKISEDWFPQVQADVFISHAHADSEEAIGLAGWLYEKFGLKAFIDSTVWGYADTLLKKLDDKYCKNERTDTYIYETRNKTTSNVHIILSSALHRMIDSCECVIFLNTPNSASFKGYVTETATHSPWIYSEILMTQLVKPKSPKRKELLLKSRAAVEALDESVSIKHDLSLNHLASIGNRELNAWHLASSLREINGAEALDVLYRIA